MKVGLIGCGNIGTVVAKAIDDGEVPNTQLICVYDKTRENAEKLIATLKGKPVIEESVLGCVNQGVEVVVEAASQAALMEHLTSLLKKGVSVLAMSAGALLDEKLIREVRLASAASGARVYVPSGAIAGLDGLKSASCGRIDEVALTSIKPIRSLKGNEYLSKQGINVDSCKRERVVFEGFAKEAAAYFPKSINVCAALSLAGIGAEKTKVTIILDPNASRIRHIVSVRGAFGEFTVEVNNIPSSNNPKTSYLASLSAIATLRNLTQTGLDIGT